MNQTNRKFLYIITAIIALLAVIAAGIGLFYMTGGLPFDYVNQYGDTVRIYGTGLYAQDSYFKAPIFRGTDLVILFVAVPLLLVAMLLDMKRKTLKCRLFLVSMISVFTYYSTSIVFGVTYNFLLLVYIALFSASLFGLIAGFSGIDLKNIPTRITGKLPIKGVYAFLIFTGIALVIAWLPDIIAALAAKRSLLLIENYTTEITYALDMGVIAPAAWVCLSLLRRKAGAGYVLLGILLTLCAVIGVMLPVQTVFQTMAGIVTPVPVMITKIGIFCLLAIFAVYFEVKLLKAVDGKG